MATPSVQARIKDLRLLPRKRFKEVKKFLSYSATKSSSLTSDQVHSLIADKIMSQVPFFVIRPGGTEQRILGLYLKERIRGPRSSGLSDSLRTKLSGWIRGQRDENDYGPQLYVGESLSGISPPSLSTLDEFSVEYLRAIGNADLLVHYEWSVWIRSLKLARNKPNADYDAFDPLDRALRKDGDSWLTALENRRVLIVSPFADSIRSQYDRKSKISIVQDILPDFDLLTLKPPVTFAGKRSNSNWFRELENLRRTMDSIDFDVAVTSAGAYGAPIAGYAKQLGRVGIHYGGACSCCLVSQENDGERSLTISSTRQEFSRTGLNQPKPRSHRSQKLSKVAPTGEVLTG